MANNQYVNKVIYAGQVLLDLTADDVTAADVANGKKFHTRSGESATGTNKNDANTSDANAVAAEILDKKTAYVQGAKVTGTMPNRAGVTGAISTVNGTYTIQNGYHDGSGTVGISSAEQAKIIAGNIKSGVSILGVTGSYEGEGGTGQTKNVEPYTTAQQVLPDEDYDYLTQVNVAAIYYNEQDNDQGGKTVTIGKVAPTT